MADAIEDEELCDSWEDMIDSGVLERKLEVINCSSSVVNHTCPVEDITENGNRPVGIQPVLYLEETSRTQYVPPEPQVKILKRPVANSTVVINGDKSSSKPGKSLQQREAEYAEARLRILGSAKSEEEVVEERLALMSVTSEPTPRSPSPALVISTRQPTAPPVSPAVTVIRQARGPEPGKNFAARR